MTGSSFSIFKPKSVNRMNRRFHSKHRPRHHTVVFPEPRVSFPFNHHSIHDNITTVCFLFLYSFSFLQPHPHTGHVYEIYTYININFLDLFVAGRTTVRVVDQIQLTGCKGMLSWFVDMSNKFLFYIYICKFNLPWALRFHPLLAKNVYNLDLFFFSFLSSSVAF